MSEREMRDIVVLLPGITGSVLQKDGKDVWSISGGAAMRALLSLGGSIDSLRLHEDPPDADDLGDGVAATRIMPDLSLIPGFWKIDGYGKIAQTVRRRFDVVSGDNYFEFPYDWRRDNRVAARRLARESRRWLADWRENSGNPDAKLILIAHSMGGLVSRYFLEVLEGWRDTRLLVTFGTPYQGSMNALSFLVNGMRKKLGPLTLVDLSDLLRSFTSVYQLLPTYGCVDEGRPELSRVASVTGLPGVDQQKTADALAFHDEIAKAAAAHAGETAYVEEGYQMQPIVGIFQPTLQSARIDGDDIEFLRSYKGKDDGGDGTVPRISATPAELRRLTREVYLKECHASLQNTDEGLTQLEGVLSSLSIDLGLYFAPPTGVSLDVDDVHLAGDAVPIAALPEAEYAQLEVRLTETSSDHVEVVAPLTVGDDGWHAVVLEPLPPGTYRVTVSGEGDIAPVSDLIAVFAAA